MLDGGGLLLGMRLGWYDECCEFGVRRGMNGDLVDYVVDRGWVSGNGVEGGGWEMGDEFEVGFGVWGRGR